MYLPVHVLLVHMFTYVRMCEKAVETKPIGENTLSTPSELDAENADHVALGLRTTSYQNAVGMLTVSSDACLHVADLCVCVCVHLYVLAMLTTFSRVCSRQPAPKATKPEATFITKTVRIS